MSVHMAKPHHEVLYQELVELVAKHAGMITPIEILAIAANMLGKLIAMQDQRVTSPAVAMEVVSRNIKAGNKQVIDELAQSAGSA